MFSEKMRSLLAGFISNLLAGFIVLLASVLFMVHKRDVIVQLAPETHVTTAAAVAVPNGASGPSENLTTNSSVSVVVHRAKQK